MGEECIEDQIDNKLRALNRDGTQFGQVGGWYKYTGGKASKIDLSESQWQSR